MHHRFDEASTPVLQSEDLVSMRCFRLVMSRMAQERRVIRKGTEEQSRYVGGQVSSVHLGPKETTSDPYLV